MGDDKKRIRKSCNLDLNLLQPSRRSNCHLSQVRGQFKQGGFDTKPTPLLLCTFAVDHGSSVYQSATQCVPVSHSTRIDDGPPFTHPEAHTNNRNPPTRTALQPSPHECDYSTTALSAPSFANTVCGGLTEPPLYVPAFSPAHGKTAEVDHANCHPRSAFAVPCPHRPVSLIRPLPKATSSSHTRSRTKHETPLVKVFLLGRVTTATTIAYSLIQLDLSITSLGLALLNMVRRCHICCSSLVAYMGPQFQPGIHLCRLI